MSCLKHSTVNRGPRRGTVASITFWESCFQFKVYFIPGHRMVLREMQKLPHIWSGQIRCFSTFLKGRECSNMGGMALGIDGLGTGNSRVPTTPSFLLHSVSPVVLPLKHLLGLSHLHSCHLIHFLFNSLFASSLAFRQIP